MKVNDTEKQSLSDAIDKLNEGLDVVIGIYNEAEEDKLIIKFDDEVILAIEKAKATYGEEEITRRINTIIKEVFAFLPKDNNEETE